MIVATWLVCVFVYACDCGYMVSLCLYTRVIVATWLVCVFVYACDCGYMVSLCLCTRAA